MKRSIEYYQDCPAMVNFGFIGKESFYSPEVVALAVAIENHMNVIVNPKYRVYMTGEAILPEGKGASYEGRITRLVLGLEFQKVRYADGTEKFELHIFTNDGKFLAWCDNDGITLDMVMLLQQVRKENSKLSDYLKYFEDMNNDYDKYEIVA